VSISTIEGGADGTQLHVAARLFRQLLRAAAPTLAFRQIGYSVAFALTKEVFWILVLLSSLGIWAAIWAAAASLASAWLQ
jgi:hypothetical protein